MKRTPRVADGQEFFRRTIYYLETHGFNPRNMIPGDWDENGYWTPLTGEHVAWPNGFDYRAFEAIFDVEWDPFYGGAKDYHSGMWPRW